VFSREERACARDADCAFVSFGTGCECTPCMRQWAAAANKRAAERIERAKPPRQPCPPVTCAPCPPLPTRPGAPPLANGFVGDKAACLQGQCTTCLASGDCAPESP
jgi:hypothetical protein